MLKMAKKQNICAVVATPHYSNHFRNDKPEVIRELCRTLEQKARKEVDPHFRIFSGQENLASEDILELLDKRKVLTLAGSSYVLMEFLPSTPYSNIFRTVQSLLLNQYQPILAHVERYDVLREKGRIEELIEIGATIQMNYRPIGGRWYDETTRWCRKMLKEGNVHLLGTDMHNTKARSPETADAAAWMEKHLDPSYVQEISYRNPLKIIKHEKI